MKSPGLAETKGKDFVYRSGPTHELGSQFDAANKTIDEFISYSKLNKFWVDKMLFDEIENVALRLDKIIHGAAFHCGVSPANANQFDQAMEDNKRSVAAINEEIPAAKEKIVERMPTKPNITGRNTCVTDVPMQREE